VGPGYYAALARQQGLVLEADDPEAGLLPDFAALRGPAFDPDRVDPRIRDFYEHTARYRLVVASRWSPLFLPLGWLLVGAVSRRIAQLNFPLGVHEARGEMTSQVLRLREPAGGRYVPAGCAPNRRPGTSSTSGCTGSPTHRARPGPASASCSPCPTAAAPSCCGRA
jgi:hypothetical protein